MQLSLNMNTNSENIRADINRVLNPPKTKQARIAITYLRLIWNQKELFCLYQINKKYCNYTIQTGLNLLTRFKNQIICL